MTTPALAPSRQLDDILMTTRPCRHFSRQLLAPFLESPLSAAVHGTDPASPSASTRSSRRHQARRSSRDTRKLPTSASCEHVAATLSSPAEREEDTARRVCDAVRLLVRSVEGTLSLPGMEARAASAALSLSSSFSGATRHKSPSRAQSVHSLHSGRDPLRSLGGSWRRGSEAGPWAVVPPATLLSPDPAATTNSAPLPVCPHTLLYLLHLVAERTEATAEPPCASSHLWCARTGGDAAPASEPPLPLPHASSPYLAGMACSQPASTSASRTLWLETLKQIALFFSIVDRRGLGELVAGALLFGEPRFSPAWEAQQLNLYSLPLSRTEPGERADFLFYRCDCDDLSSGDDDEEEEEQDYEVHEVDLMENVEMDAAMPDGRLSVGPAPCRPAQRTLGHRRRASHGNGDELTIWSSSSSSSSSSSLPSSSSSRTSSAHLLNAPRGGCGRSSSCSSSLAASSVSLHSVSASLSDPTHVSSPTRRASARGTHADPALQQTLFAQTDTPLRPSLSFLAAQSESHAGRVGRRSTLVETSISGDMAKDADTAAAAPAGTTRSRTSRRTASHLGHQPPAASLPVHPDQLSLSQHFQLVLYRLMDAHGASGHCAPAASTLRTLARTRAVLVVLLALPLSASSAAAAHVSAQASAQGGGSAQPHLQTSPFSPGYISSGGGGGFFGLQRPPTPQTPTAFTVAGMALPHVGLHGGLSGPGRSMPSLHTPTASAISVRRAAAGAAASSRGAPSGAASVYSGAAVGSNHRFEQSGGERYGSAGPCATNATPAHSAGVSPGCGYPLSPGGGATVSVTAASTFASTFLGHLLPFLRHPTLSICTQSWQTLRHVLSSDPGLAAPFLLYYMQEIVTDIILAHLLLPASADTAEQASPKEGEARSAREHPLGAHPTTPAAGATHKGGIEAPQAIVPPHFIAQQEALSLLVRILRDSAYLEAQTRYRLSPALLCGVLTLTAHYHAMVVAREEQWRRRCQRRLTQEQAHAAAQWARQREAESVAGASTTPGTHSLSSTPQALPQTSAPSFKAATTATEGDIIRSDRQLTTDEGNPSSVFYGDETGVYDEDEEDCDDDDDEEDDAFFVAASIIDLIPYRHRAAMRLTCEALYEFIVHQDKSAAVRYLLLSNKALLDAFIRVAGTLPPVSFSHDDVGTPGGAGATEALDRQRVLYLLDSVPDLQMEELLDLQLM